MTSPIPEFVVRASILVVPNGTTANGDMRLSLQITPVAPLPDTPKGALIDLSQWPSQVRSLASAVKVYLADIDAADKLGAPIPLQGVYASDIHWTAASIAGANALWRQTFEGRFGDLKTIRTPPSAAGNQAAMAMADPTIQIAPMIDSYFFSHELLARYRQRAADAINTSSGAGAKAAVLPARPYAQIERWVRPGDARDPVGVMIDGVALKAQRQALRANYGQVSRAAGFSAAAMDVASQRVNDAPSLGWLRARHRADELRGIQSPEHGLVVEHLSSAAPDPIAHHLDEFALAMATGSPSTAKPPDLPKPDQFDTVRRKFASILAYPTIAKYLSMAIDIVVPAQDWEQAAKKLHDKSYGTVAASIGDSVLPADADWSAFVHGGRFAAANFFGPCDATEAHGETNVEAVEIVGGILNLRVTDTGQPRYKLSVIDVINSVARQKDHALEVTQKLRSGLDPPQTEPNPVGRSIALIDSRAHDQVTKAAARERAALNAASSGGGTHLNFAHDLLRGYTAMAALTRPATNTYTEDASRWRTLVGRTISMASDQVDPGFVSAIAYQEREFGIVKQIPTEQAGQDDNGSPVTTISNPQELLAWHGDSLTVASPSEGRAAQVTIISDQDLAVGMTFHLPDAPLHGAPDYRPPPLRDGRSYLFGMSASYVNGCGLSHLEALSAHAEDRYHHVLGDASGAPFQFQRPDKIPAPLMLLPADSPLVTSSHTDQLRGETLQTLVVRTADHDRGPPRVLRYFFPHGIDFDRAEQQDQFRGVKDSVPPGVFTGPVGLVWRDGGGAFPVAAAGHIVTSTEPQKASRGLVLQMQARPSSDTRQYYADANSQRLRMHLTANVPADLSPPALSDAVPFWSSGQLPKQALPILLELIALKFDRAAPRVVIRSDLFERIYPVWSASSIKIKKISIGLQPATTIDVEAVAESDPDRLLTQHIFGEALMADARQRLGAGASDTALQNLAKATLAQMLSQGVVSELNGARPVTLVHAQQRPAPPVILMGDVRITPVAVTVAPEKSTGQGQTWSDVAASRYGSHQKKYAQWESNTGGATCFFVGQVQVDSPATGALRCEASWTEEGPEYLKINTNKTLYRYVPANNGAQLFSITAINSALTANQIDLLGDFSGPDLPGVLRRLAYSFPDGRARHLRLRLIATSRFLEYFDSKVVKDFESASDPVDIWLTCTFRPSPLTVDRITPVFDHDVRSDGKGKFSFTRTTRLRLELGNDPRMSGAGEKVGVLFRKNNPEQVCDLFTPELAPYADGFTRWGRDPLHESAVSTILDPARFARAANLPIQQGVLKSGREDATDDGQLVYIVPHETRLDPGAGFYCDVVLDPQNTQQRAQDLASANAYMPFVHLGLARYQEHSVKGLELSHAIGRDVQLLPWRHGSIEFVDKQTFVLRMEGPIYGQPEQQENKDTLPWIDVTLLHNETSDTLQINWKPVSGDPEKTQGYRIPPQASADGKRWLWQWKGRFPQSQHTHRYGLRIEEYERIRDYPSKIAHVRGPIFSTTINLSMRGTHNAVELVAPL